MERKETNKPKKTQQQQGKRSTISKHPTNSKTIILSHKHMHKNEHKHERRNVENEENKKATTTETAIVKNNI